MQAIFRAFAGVGSAGYGDTLWNIQSITAGNSGAENDTGLIYFLFNTPLIKNLITSIMLLGFFLLIIFTVMAFIKNAYSSKPKSWKDIIGNAIKGLANFIFLPVCCLLGIWAGNILLNAIDGATSTGGATLMSRKLFICAAYNANYYRNGDADDTDSKAVLQAVYNYAKNANIITEGEIPVTQAEIDAAKTNDEMAALVDEIYASGAMNIYTHDGAAHGYSLYQINYLTLIIGGVFMMYILVSLAYGMIRRMFILLMLYVISPGLCAMYPLDEGKAVGAWKSDFVKQTISAYGAVAGMNIFFSLLPLVNNIQLVGYRHVNTDSFHSGATDVLANILTAVNNIVGIDTIIQLIIIVSGMFVVKELISMISGYIGADDAFSKGASLRGQTKKAMKDYGSKAVQKASKYGHAFGDVYKRSVTNSDGSTSRNPFKHLGAAGKGYFSAVRTGLKDGLKTSKDKLYENNSFSKDWKAGGDDYKRQQDISKLIEDSEKYNYSADSTGFIAKGLRSRAEELGILDDIDKAIVKKRGKGETLEGYRKNVELSEAYSKSEKDFGKARAESKAFDTSIGAVQRAYEKFEMAKGTSDAAAKKASLESINRRLIDNHGINFEEIAKELKRALSSKDIASQIIAGRTISAEEMDINKIQTNYGVSRSEAVDMANAFQKLNGIIERKKSYDEKFAEASDKLKEATKALKGWQDGSKATTPSFDKATIESMVTAIEKATNTRSDVAYDTSTMRTLNETVSKLLEVEKRQADELKKMAKDNKIRDAAEKAEKSKKK